jgi:hypothetical protein
MPFTLHSSGDKQFVESQVNGQIQASYDQSPKGKDRDESKKHLERIRDALFKTLSTDFPKDSPTGLVLVGDAGPNHISITNLQFSIAKPAKEANEKDHPAPVKEEKVPEAKSMVPPAPDKGPTNPSSTTNTTSTTK